MSSWLSKIRTGCPGKPWRPHPWRCSSNEWTQHSVRWSERQGVDQSQVGLHDPWVLFWDSFRCYLYLHNSISKKEFPAFFRIFTSEKNITLKKRHIKSLGRQRESCMFSFQCRIWIFMGQWKRLQSMAATTGSKMWSQPNETSNW